MLLRLVAPLLLVLYTGPVLAQPAFPLEAVMGAPFPSELVAAPTADRVAWIQNAEGVRNVWVAEGPDFRPRRITTHTDDDGHGLYNLSFARPGDTHVLFETGGSPNRSGDYPNPSSRALAPRGGLFLAPIDSTGAARFVAGGTAPLVSPDGRTLAFRRGSSLWTLDLMDAAAEAVRRFEVRGLSSPVWSPDGTRLAFVSGRGDHSFVGVYDVADETLRYLDPSVDHDRRPVWSPDGTQLAFTREPHVPGTLPFFARPDGPGWSIRVADVAAGTSRAVWASGPGPGSLFRGATAPSALLWMARGQLVFPWEGNGWTQLYRVAAAGGPATPLAGGDYEVQWYAPTPDGGHVLYSSNQGDIDRRHVWRAPVLGRSAVQRLTPPEGLAWAPVQTTGGHVVVLASGAQTPAHVAHVAEGRTVPLLPLPDDFPTAHLVVPEGVVFPATDGLPIHGQRFDPPASCGAGPHPGLLFFHGGSRRQMLLGFHHRGYYHNAYAFNQYMAARCYVVLSVNYRSGIGYGLAFREAEHYGADGASEYQDVLGAGLYLGSLPEVDEARLGLWGGSYGGYLTALGLARASDRFAAGVDIHGVHDWNVAIQNFVPSYDPAEDPERTRRAFASSPLADVDAWRAPVLLIHGDDDRNVPFSETVDLVRALRARGVPFESLVFPGEVHSFLRHANWLAAYHAAADFLDRHLK